MFPLPTLIGSLLAASTLATQSLAQFAPYDGNLTYIESPYDLGINISYRKVPKGVCQTAFDSQIQYTGWISVPGEFPTNIFYWLVYAREPTNALTVWLNGGPGSTSMIGFFTGAGPCEVVEKGADRLETVAREWGWDRASNMVFFDQPNQVGFSFDSPTNKSVDFQFGNFTQVPQSVPKGRNPLTFLNGTFPTYNPANTANTSSQAAMAMWHAMQVFLGEFLQPKKGDVEVSLFAESYGGRYGPVFFDTWEAQNVQYQTNDSVRQIHLTALGIVNGCVDDLIQAPYYTEMMVNNTYGIKMLSATEAQYYNGTFSQQNGCRDLIKECRDLNSRLDPDNHGNIPDVNQACSAASQACLSLVEPYMNTGRDPWDIAFNLPNSFPSSLYAEYLNTRKVQVGIGSIVNFTSTASFIPPLFIQTGDYQRGPIIPKLSGLLLNGVRIGLIYGDRDFICNWLGGEALSLAIASDAGGNYASQFPTAGYAPIIVNETYVGGQVRQYGNLSFSRIFQAGHAVPAYQPETAFQVFARIILGTDISTGGPVDLSSYTTTGDVDANRNSQSPPNNPAPTCYVRNMRETCPDDSVTGLLNGDGVVINGIWYSSASDWPGAPDKTSPSDSSTGGGGGSPATPTTTAELTGVFTATSTPKDPNAASSLLSTNSMGVGFAVISCFMVGLLVIV
ncbi:putative carboxypeptidase [Rhypophila decipiens]|uniref:Carboxypeptidase n=1 Tax=Rhypophila decipiens TaxID=261697 RepID=A0AAN6YIL0_9PEZI|nr:putative carboxypeptidase [Rhypophila decipiens]